MKTKSSVVLNVVSAMLALTAANHGAAAASDTIEVTPGSCGKINEAVAALPNTGGTVKLAAGEFVCESPVIIERDNVNVIGAGSSKTFIRAADGKAMPVVIIGSVINMLGIAAKKDIPYPTHVTRNIKLSGISINGNFRKHPNPGGFECWDPKTDKSLTCGKDIGFFIRNNGLTIRRAEHVRVTDLETKQAFSGGIVLEKLNSDIIMDGWTATDNFFDGFAGYETNFSIFRNFRVYENIYSGISVDCDFSGNVFEDGIADKNGDNGIFSADVSWNLYRRLKVLDNKNLGFYIDGTRTPDQKPIPGTCDGNQIEDTVISGPKFGVQVNFDCKGMKITNTKIRQPKMECISLFPGLDITITGSTCSNSINEISIDKKPRATPL